MIKPFEEPWDYKSLGPTQGVLQNELGEKVTLSVIITATYDKNLAQEFCAFLGKYDKGYAKNSWGKKWASEELKHSRRKSKTSAHV